MPPLPETDTLTARTEDAEAVRFCSRCGSERRPGEGEGARRLGGRVCEACGMGVMLRCAPEELPGAGSTFLVVTAELEVSAVSEGAEPLLGTEEAVLGTDLREVVSCPLGEEMLVEGVKLAVAEATDSVTVPVRRASNGDGAGMMAARIAPCGPPPAALVALEPSPFGKH